MPKIRIVVVDDHEVVRHGLRLSLGAEPDMVVVGEAATGEEAVKLTVARRPDVLLLDVKLQDVDGPEVCRWVVAEAPKTSVVMLTSYRNDAMVLRSLIAGAKGYVVKEVELTELKRMIRAVYRGHAVLDPSVAPHVIAAATSNGAVRAPEGGPKHVAGFADIDVAIVRHLAKGLTNKEIASLVHLSPYTVKDHLKKIASAFDARSRTEIVATALRAGLI